MVALTRRQTEVLDVRDPAIWSNDRTPIPKDASMRRRVDTTPPSRSIFSIQFHSKIKKD